MWRVVCPSDQALSAKPGRFGAIGVQGFRPEWLSANPTQRPRANSARRILSLSHLFGCPAQRAENLAEAFRAE